jgi:hypothetical protein
MIIIEYEKKNVIQHEMIQNEKKLIGDNFRKKAKSTRKWNTQKCLHMKNPGGGGAYAFWTKSQLLYYFEFHCFFTGEIFWKNSPPDRPPLPPSPFVCIYECLESVWKRTWTAYRTDQITEEVFVRSSVYIKVIIAAQNIKINSDEQSLSEQ